MPRGDALPTGSRGAAVDDLSWGAGHSDLRLRTTASTTTTTMTESSRTVNATNSGVVVVPPAGAVSLGVLLHFEWRGLGAFVMIHFEWRGLGTLVAGESDLDDGAGFGSDVVAVATVVPVVKEEGDGEGEIDKYWQMHCRSREHTAAEVWF